MSEEIKKVEHDAGGQNQNISDAGAVAPKRIAKPKLFFKHDDRIEVSVTGYHNMDSGNLALVVPTEESDKEDVLQDLFTKVEYKFWFTRVSYDKLNRYRNRSMIYNSEDQNNTINQLRLREFFLVYHLVDWNITDDDGNKVMLKFDPNKALSDESLEVIYSLPSNLVDMALITFERRMAL